MQAFLEYVVKGLVQKPEAITVTPVETNGMTVYELRMDPLDVGRIIGCGRRRCNSSKLCFRRIAA